MSTGRLWTSQLDDAGAPVWVLEWPIRTALRRRLLIAVDTSDSCWGEQTARRDALASLGRHLRGDDRCMVWIMGREEGFEIGGRGRVDAQSLLAASARLEPVRGGTWIARTVRAMLAEPEAPGERRFFAIVSDGEVFDAEELARLPRLGFFRTGECESPRVDTVLRYATELTTAAETDRFLASPVPQVSCELGWSGARASRYDQHGKLVDGDTLTVDPGQPCLRVVMVGGERPVPRLVYQVDDTIWVDHDVSVDVVTADGPRWLNEVVSQLRRGATLEWNLDALATLATAQGTVVRLRCPSGHAPSDASRRLYCDACDRLLVASRPVRRDQLPSALRAFVRFEVVSGQPQHPGEPSAMQTRDHAYDLRTDEDGRQWLVLNLLAS